MLWLIVTDGASCLIQELIVVSDYVARICPHVELASFHIHNPTDRVKGFYDKATIAIDCRTDQTSPLGSVARISESIPVVSYSDWWEEANKFLEKSYDRP